MAVSRHAQRSGRARPGRSNANRPGRRQTSSLLPIATTAVAVVAIIATLWFTGFAIMPVRSSSMEPTARPGDAVIGISTRLAPPAVGDIVVAEPQIGDAQVPPTAHRIIGATDGGWRTQGDNNPNADGWTVKPDDITHTAVAVAPLRFLRNPLLVGIAAGVVALVALWPRSDRAVSNRRRQLETSRRVGTHSVAESGAADRLYASQVFPSTGRVVGPRHSGGYRSNAIRPVTSRPARHRRRNAAPGPASGASDSTTRAGSA